MMLGNPYNKFYSQTFFCRSNIAFPESSFWNQTQLEEHTVISKRLNVDLDVQSLYRTVDRTSYFDISAWLTVDFMGKCTAIDCFEITSVLKVDQCMLLDPLVSLKKKYPVKKR